jgi:hypothetical protein
VPKSQDATEAVSVHRLHFKSRTLGPFLSLPVGKILFQQKPLKYFAQHAE